MRRLPARIDHQRINQVPIVAHSILPAVLNGKLPGGANAGSIVRSIQLQAQQRRCEVILSARREERDQGFIEVMGVDPGS